jgi:5-(carboxyamino)imidazole ribonucleotide synthase
VTHSPFLPGSTIGIVGGGQLGRMLVMVARRMGYRTIVIDPDPAAPAGELADEHLVAHFTDIEAAETLARSADVVTLEWENTDVATLRSLEGRLPLRPGPHVLEVAQNRVREKEAARRLGLATADFRAVRSLDDLRRGCGELGLPALLKTATGGYDGRGQYPIRESSEIDSAFAALGGGEVELILEAWVAYRMEVSVICARSVDGDVKSFPVVENLHSGGILDFTLAPARLPDHLLEQARAVGEALVEGLDVVGLLAVEMFVDDGDRILVNEIAPRPHNSGHYTMEACSVSQFEQQLRAVCGLPLADPRLLLPAAMVNLLGQHVGTGAGLRSIMDALARPMLTLHLYGKRSARTGRKMGHLTALSDDADLAYHQVREARDALEAEFARVSASAGRTDTR